MPEETKTTETPKIDPFDARILSDLGKALDEKGEIVPLTEEKKAELKKEETSPSSVLNESFTPIAERAKFNDEATKREEGKTEEQKSAEAISKSSSSSSALPSSSSSVEPKVKVKKDRPLAEVVEEAVRKAIPQTEKKEEKVVTLPEKKEDEEAIDETGLDDDQKDELELARFAAKQDGKRYGELPKKLSSFWKSIDDYVAKASAEDPNRTFDENDEEYQKWLRAQDRPVLSQVERRRLEKEKIKDEIRQEEGQQVSQATSRLERKIREMEAKPIIDEVKSSLPKRIIERMATVNDSPVKDLADKIKTEGVKALEEEFPVEMKQVEVIHKRATDLATEMMNLATGASDFALHDPKLPHNHIQNQRAAIHSELVNWVNNQDALFQQIGKDSLVRRSSDGSVKMFMPRAQYMSKLAQDPSSVAANWTWEPQDYVEFMAMEAAIRSNAVIKTSQDALKAAGYERKRKSPETKTETKDDKGPGSKVTPKLGQTMAPGAGKGGKIEGGGIFSPSELESLGINPKS